MQMLIKILGLIQCYRSIGRIWVHDFKTNLSISSSKTPDDADLILAKYKLTNCENAGR